MRTKRTNLAPSILCLALSAVGCTFQTEDASTGQTESALVSSNALTVNALTANALTANALTANALTANALTANALTANALTANGLRDPLSRLFLKYVVSCALDRSQSVSFAVDGESYVLPGEIGLAPAWGLDGGVCDGGCQRWVSACVLARVDYEGVHRDISIRGAHSALRVEAHEMQRFSEPEATYYGNVFSVPKALYGCLAPSVTGDARVCGPSLATCPMQVTGSCDDVCRRPGANRSFAQCAASSSGPVYGETVSVFLAR